MNGPQEGSTTEETIMKTEIESGGDKGTTHQVAVEESPMEHLMDETDASKELLQPPLEGSAPQMPKTSDVTGSSAEKEEELQGYLVPPQPVQPYFPELPNYLLPPVPLKPDSPELQRVAEPSSGKGKRKKEKKAMLISGEKAGTLVVPQQKRRTETNPRVPPLYLNLKRDDYVYFHDDFCEDDI